MHNLCKLSVIRMEIRIWRQFKLEALTDSAVCVSRSAQCSGVRSFNRPVLLLLSARLLSVFVVLRLLKHWHITSFTVEESAINPRKWANGGFTSQPPTIVLSFCPERTVCLERNRAQAKKRTKTFLPPKKEKISPVETVNLPSVEMCRWRWKEPD